MRTIRIFEISSFILAAILGVSLCFTSPAFATTSVIVNPDGKLMYLGTLGGRHTHASDINDTGRVVGYSDTVQVGGAYGEPIGDGRPHAFITGPNGAGMIDLGTLPGKMHSRASAINDSGQVVGYSSTRDYVHDKDHAFITGPNGAEMTDLGTLPGKTYSRASGINDSGQVVGSSYAAGGEHSRAFITGPNGMGMTDLGHLGGDSGGGTAVNDSGQVVGESSTGKVDASGHLVTHAFITGSSGVGMTDLGTLGGYLSRASDINAAGQVVGDSLIGSAFGPTHAFITGPNGMRMTDLGTLGGTYSWAFGINDSGQVVGSSLIESGFGGPSHAFITGTNGKGMIDLNSLVTLPDGYYLSSANEINNLGQVIATMVPEPASYALMLIGLGLVGFAGRKKKTEDTV